MKDGVEHAFAVQIKRVWYNLCPALEKGAHSLCIGGDWYGLSPRFGAPPDFFWSGPTPDLDDTAAAIAAEAKRVLRELDTSVEEIDVSGIPLPRSDVERVAAALGSAGCSVASLRLAGCGLGSAVGALAALVSAAVRCASLRRLCLARNGIGPQGAERLAAALAAPGAGLAELDLSGNLIGLVGAQKLARALERQAGAGSAGAFAAPLRDLRLARCGLGEPGCARLANALRSEGCGLRALDVSGNGAGRFGGEVYARALAAKSSGLQALDLGANGLEDGGALHIAGALRGNSALTVLSLADNDLTDYSAKALVAAAEGSETLKRLDLEGNDVSDQVASALAEALPRSLAELAAPEEEGAEPAAVADA